MDEPDKADQDSVPDWWFMDRAEWKSVPGKFGLPLVGQNQGELEP